MLRNWLAFRYESGRRYFSTVCPGIHWDDSQMEDAWFSQAIVTISFEENGVFLSLLTLDIASGVLMERVDEAICSSGWMPVFVSWRNDISQTSAGRLSLFETWIDESLLSLVKALTNSQIVKRFREKVI
jgi:hypothetical protein